MIQFEEYLRTIYPPPQEGDKLYSFYEQWGYEQFLIKTQKHDIEQLRILHAHDYNMAQLASFGKTPEDISQKAKELGSPLVEAQKDWTGFVSRKVVRGLVGIALWQCEDGGSFCIFPNLNTNPLCRPYIGPVSKDQIKPLGIPYESEEQVIELSMERIDKEAI